MQAEGLNSLGINAVCHECSHANASSRNAIQLSEFDDDGQSEVPSYRKSCNTQGVGIIIQTNGYHLKLNQSCINPTVEPSKPNHLLSIDKNRYSFTL